MLRETWLPAAPESAPIARSLVRDAAAGHGLGTEAVWDLMLATTEAVANAIEHGAPCCRGIRLVIEPSEHGMTVEVWDCGRFEATLTPAALDDTRGRGIPIIAAVVDTLELDGNGPPTRVRFAKLSAA